ncbi:Thioredoxin reductase [Neolewinella agarilytica]|uniref:Thioredoxin reductase n=2 Tax=Neolewinella agarilytica TaxID=478744 RepID=A0A1H9I9L2_9BACT|nr:Thioredoxin reductase [Neolewinella agarilytica]
MSKPGRHRQADNSPTCRRTFLKRNGLGLIGVLLATDLSALHQTEENMTTEHTNEDHNYEVIIIGGSYAGLSAGLAMGRSIRKTLIIDGGKPCNRQTPHTHNFITHDGDRPHAVAADAKRDVLKYPTVSFVNSLVTKVKGSDGAFELTTTDGNVYLAQKILFATGVKDIMPAIPGLAESWGISVIHCPYCHGYEVRSKRTGILANSPAVKEFVKMILNWTDQLTLFTNGPADFPVEEVTALGVDVVTKVISDIDHAEGYINHLNFSDGSKFELDALYYRAALEQHCKAPEEMGCVITDTGHIEVNQFQQTSVPGVYAAGDMASPFRAVSLATAQGTVAGAMMNHELINAH